jgi:hypothetical protein
MAYCLCGLGLIFHTFVQFRNAIAIITSTATISNISKVPKPSSSFQNLCTIFFTMLIFELILEFIFKFIFRFIFKFITMIISILILLLHHQNCGCSNHNHNYQKNKNHRKHHLGRGFLTECFGNRFSFLPQSEGKLLQRHHKLIATAFII